MSIGAPDAIDASSLDVLVPAESALDIEKFLGPSGSENSRAIGQHILSNLTQEVQATVVPQRDVLYFGRSPAQMLQDSVLLLILGNEQTSLFLFISYYGLATSTSLDI